MTGSIIFGLLLAFVVVVTLVRMGEVTLVYPPDVGLLYRNGTFVRELSPGRYSRFDPLRRTKIVKISLAELPISFGETTVLSKDQFSFRLSVALTLAITDPRRYVESQGTIEQFAFFPYQGSLSSHSALQTLLPAAAMEVVSGMTLTEILAGQAAVTEALKTRLVDAVPGASVARVLLTGINLPPETRKMFTDVERSKLEAQASLERARGEQAALRVLANAARLTADNPALANLRLLQTIENAKSNMTVVLGSGPILPGAIVPSDPDRKP